MARVLILLLLLWLASPVLADEMCGKGGCCCPAGQCGCGHAPKVEKGCGCQMAPTLPAPTRAQREDLLATMPGSPALETTASRPATETEFQPPPEWIPAPPSPPPRRFLLTPA